MKISTKGRYAIRLMIDLAMFGEGGFVPVKTISERQGISEKYLEQIISLLCKAGYVKSVRGAGGGYKLTKPCEEYSVGNILRITEGSLAPVNCLEDEENPCDRQQGCASLYIYKKIFEAVNEVVDGISLKDLVDFEQSADKEP